MCKTNIHQGLSVTEIKETLGQYFKKDIEAEAFSAIMRRFINASVMLQLRSDSDEWKDDIANGYFFLTDFLEKIDPCLEK